MDGEPQTAATAAAKGRIRWIAHDKTQKNTVTADNNFFGQFFDN